MDRSPPSQTRLISHRVFDAATAPARQPDRKPSIHRPAVFTSALAADRSRTAQRRRRHQPCLWPHLFVESAGYLGRTEFPSVDACWRRRRSFPQHARQSQLRCRLRWQPQLASYFPGEWSSRDGTPSTPVEDYRKVADGMSILLIRWQTGVQPQQGLEALATLGDTCGLIAAKLERLRQPAAVLEDWSHLWFLDPSEIYRRCKDETKAGAICCRTERDVAIGGPMPQRIVHVWLISVSLFQRKPRARGLRRYPLQQQRQHSQHHLSRSAGLAARHPKIRTLIPPACAPPSRGRRRRR